MIKLLADSMPELLPMKRSAGAHVSTSIYRACVRLGHLEDDPSSEVNQMRFELGSAFEWALIHRMMEDAPGRFVQPGEISKDGIVGTPDLFEILPDGRIIIHEMKCTWMSSRHDPESPKLWRYWVQLRSYCHMAGADTGVLHVCFVNGDYRDSGPQYRRWSDKWTKRELIENWAMIRTNASVDD